MAEVSRKEEFADKYPAGEKIWSGESFIQYHDYRTLLAELPISSVAAPDKEYTRKIPGNLDYVFGELLYSLSGYEGYLRDKAFPLKECFIRPIFKPHTFILEFNLLYKTKAGEEITRSCEVIRTGATSFIFFTEFYRPL